MPRTKVLELNIGDIVYGKKCDRTMLVVEKNERTNRDWDDKYKYNYLVLDLMDQGYYGICTDCNNKHFKVLA